MRIAPSIVPIGWGMLLALAPAAVTRAATHDVVAGPGFTFGPSFLAIAPGDTVRFTNAGGMHNVRFDDGSFEQPSSPSSQAWVVSVTLNQPGEYRYFCELHGGPGGLGMAGTIQVLEPDPTVFRNGFEDP